MSLSSPRSSSLPIESRGGRPLLTSGREEAVGFLRELRIEVHVDALVEESLWGVEHGSGYLRAFEPDRRSSSSLDPR